MDDKDNSLINTKKSKKTLDDLRVSVLLDENHPGGEGENGRYQESFLIRDSDHLTRLINYQSSKKRVRGTIRITDMTAPFQKEAVE
tara:strand:+ start:9146 stop:9403 length:258 start_codon:yes stop_codon:yes gene_type:complete